MSVDKLKVFISHNAEDETVATAIKDFLESVFLNCDVFVSTRDLGGGEVWIRAIQAQLEQATAIVALVTSLSDNNPWLLFESGAGFVTGKTIPLCTDGHTVDSLRPPLSLLQARNLDANGLDALANDIARLASLRQLRTYPGKEQTLQAVAEFLCLRQSATEGDGRNRSAELDYDPDIYNRRKTLVEELSDLALQAVVRAEGKFDIPSREALESLSFDDLQDIARAYNLPFPDDALWALMGFDLNLPSRDDSKWKKLNASKRADRVEEELRRFRKQYLEDA